MAISFFGLQFKEMGGGSISRSRAVADAAKPAEQQNERKKKYNFKSVYWLCVLFFFFQQKMYVFGGNYNGRYLVDIQVN